MGGQFSPSYNTRAFILSGAGIFLILLLLFHSSSSSSRSPLFETEKHKVLKRNWSVIAKDSPLEGPSPDFEKPEGFKIVGLIFYGRRATVSILDCYLQRNLAVNGGFLDEIVFLARTNDTADLAWLDARVAAVPQYQRRNLTGFEYHNYTSAWDGIEPGSLYIKIDDDVVFIEDTAIPALVETKIEHPEYFLVSANVVNQPPLAWMHRHLGALRPYLPELIPSFQSHNLSTSRWRASHLPTWQAPPALGGASWSPDDSFVPPFQGHRWLPLAPGTQRAPSVDGTPVHSIDYDYNRGWWWWPAGAQLHYSFLSRLEDDTLYRYKFRLWDYEGLRLGIQFVAIWGFDLVQSMPIPADDEQHLSVTMPYMTGRHAVVDGRGLVAHYSFGPQQDGMRSTDILDRYRAFTEENICVTSSAETIILETS
ncbi:uncharacterized protein LTHEOB_5097 [Neofusicoccum parvum]|uniref:Uncharacterized protein LTHEOB_5097 n=1 Tax=Neofusicoccum parvum TaxID=310453 RepID=A0ACB5SNI0_9PEZI|nr:uncharacterized protein LTHEOB_5097 [Neofusicoccum parvum]